MKFHYREFDLHHLVTTKKCKINLEREFIVRASTFIKTDSNSLWLTNVFGVFDEK